MKKRMEVLSVCFEPDTLKSIRILAHEEKYRSLGDLVRDAVNIHIDKILNKKEMIRLDKVIASRR